MSTPYPWLAAVTLGGCARLNFNGPGGTGHAQIEFCFSNATGTYDPFTVANTIFNTYKTTAFVGISNQVTFESVVCLLNDAGTVVEGLSSATPVNGGISSEPVSPQVSVIVRKTTGVLGRQNRGRVYIPGLAATWLDGSTNDMVASTDLATLQTGFSTFFVDMSTANLDLQLISRKSPYHNQALQALIVEQKIGTQRRRMRKAAHR
jgi:hypothetical protein